jgi:hypothetical protein
VLCAAILLSGCIYSREINNTRREIERQAPSAEFHRVITVNLGPFGVRLARWITARVDREDEDLQRVSRYLRDVRRIKVGVFRNRGAHGAQLGDIPSLRRFQRRGWEVAVAARDDDEQLWLMYREKRGSISDIYAIVQEDDELVIARIQGHLTDLLESAIQDHDVFRDLTEVKDW